MVLSQVCSRPNFPRRVGTERDAPAAERARAGGGEG